MQQKRIKIWVLKISQQDLVHKPATRDLANESGKYYIVSSLKPSIRKHFLDIRKDVTEDIANASAAKTAYNFMQLAPLAHVKTIAIYQPIRGEISLGPLIDNITHNKVNKINLCLPIVEAKDSPLLFYPWKIGDTLENNAIYPQLLQPAVREAPIYSDLIIVPLVAFDEACNRLGYGAGFYDRTLRHLKEQNKHTLTVGYAYDFQKSESLLPTDSHDIKLDFVVTDKNVYQAE